MLTQRDIDRLESNWYERSDSTNARMHRLLHGLPRPPRLGPKSFIRALGTRARGRPGRIPSRWLRLLFAGESK